MRKMAELPGVGANVKNWLISGKDKPVTEQKQSETQQLSDDARLAHLLVDSLRFQAHGNVIAQQLLPEIEILDPRAAGPISRLLQQGIGLCDAIQSMARRKNLTARGQAGDEEDFAPLEHNLVGDATGARRVRVIRPVVEQTRVEGVSFVIIKGLAEKME